MMRANKSGKGCEHRGGWAKLMTVHRGDCHWGFSSVLIHCSGWVNVFLAGAERLEWVPDPLCGRYPREGRLRS